jgi:hypothetical protein
MHMCTCDKSAMVALQQLQMLAGFLHVHAVGTAQCTQNDSLIASSVDVLVSKQPASKSVSYGFLQM